MGAPLLSASTPVDAGADSLYLSIFDQGDSAYDSAVFVDALVLGTTGPGGCEPGATVVSMDKDVDDSSVQPGDNVTYTITVTNEGGDDAVLSSITDTLPDGFTYVPGSTSGITADEPTVTGQDLMRDGPFTVPGEVVLLGSIELSFSATASHAPGSYFNNASAQGDEVSVTPTGPDAPVTVEAPATGNIIIQKATSPECDSTVFDFTADYDESGFQLAGCEQNDSGPLDPGTYSVSELAEAGWELTETSCSDGSEVTAIDLDAGETVTCTFLNEQLPGEIIVERQTAPAEDPESFGFTTDYSDPFLLSDGQSNESGDLDPGTYSVSEQSPKAGRLSMRPAMTAVPSTRSTFRRARPSPARS